MIWHRVVIAPVVILLLERALEKQRENGKDDERDSATDNPALPSFAFLEGETGFLGERIPIALHFRFCRSRRWQIGNRERNSEGCDEVVESLIVLDALTDDGGLVWLQPPLEELHDKLDVANLFLGDVREKLILLAATDGQLTIRHCRPPRSPGAVVSLSAHSDGV